uniref:Uncharacterized protein n=1 Tax=Rhizophora mucronata TaxID=61149 RepID=A0A2P2Q5C7_RHIMU
MRKRRTNDTDNMEEVEGVFATNHLWLCIAPSRSPLPYNFPITRQRIVSTANPQ